MYPGVTETETTKERFPNDADLLEISKMNSIGRLVKPEDIANVVTFLSSPLSASITGEVIDASGGSSKTVHYQNNI